MNENSIFITAQIKVKPHIELNSGIAAIEAFCVAMNSEENCIFAYATQSIQDERHFILWECYRDQSGFDEHFSMAHTQEFIQAGLTELLNVESSTACLNAKLGYLSLVGQVK